MYQIIFLSYKQRKKFSINIFIKEHCKLKLVSETYGFVIVFRHKLKNVVLS